MNLGIIFSESHLKLAELISCDPLNHLHSAEASFMTHSKTSMPASLPLTDFGQVWKASVFSAAVTIIFGAPLKKITVCVYKKDYKANSLWTYHGQQPWLGLERFPFLVQPLIWEQRWFGSCPWQLKAWQIAWHHELQQSSHHSHLVKCSWQSIHGSYQTIFLRISRC